MNNVIYTETITDAAKSIDGESPTQVIVTEEANGFAVWFQDYYGGHILYFDRFNKMAAIKKGVELAKLPEEELSAMRWAGQ